MFLHPDLNTIGAMVFGIFGIPFLLVTITCLFVRLVPWLLWIVVLVDSIMALAGLVTAEFIIRLLWANYRRSRPHYFGPYHGSWLSLYDYCRDLLPQRRQNERLMEYVRNAGWLPYHRNLPWASKRPNVVRRDARGQLHNATGAALSCPDGWCIYAWHGILLPRWVIEGRGKITVAAILGQKNTEVRRAMRHLYGLDRFLLDAGAQEVDRSEKHGARLMRVHLKSDPEEILAVELTCPSTGRKYFERVPPNCTSVMDALAWQFQVEPKQYAPTWET